MPVVPQKQTLTVTKTGRGTVTSQPAGLQCGAQCSADYDRGGTVTLTATPDNEWTFTGWGGDCSGTGTCTVTMNPDRSVTATFVESRLLDTDGDSIPDAIERQQNTNPLVKDNDIFNDARLFAMQQYRDFLQREGDASGIAFWQTQLQSGATTRAQIIYGYLLSTEFGEAIAPVARLYFAYFRRIPDYAGLTFWVDSFKNGQSLISISQAFAESPEFRATYGNLNNRDFVSTIYQNVYGRPADSAGLDYWTGLLEQNVLSRGAVMVEFLKPMNIRPSSVLLLP